jgi:spore germination protein YaaH
VGTGNETKKATPKTSQKTPLVYSAWIPYWSKTAGAQDATAHISQFQELSPFSYEVKEDGTITDQIKSTQAPWPDLYATAKSKGVKIIPTIMWSDADSIHTILSGTTTKQFHIDQLMKIANATGTNAVDGIDIDYESKWAMTAPYFSDLLKKLATELHSSKKILVCTIEARTPLSARFVKPPKTMEYANDYKMINKYCDEVRVLAYDQENVDLQLNKLSGKGQPYMPISDSSWVRKVLNETIKTISPSKISLAVATYGRQYEITRKSSAVDSSFTYNRIGSLTFAEAMALASSTNSTLSRNSAGEIGFTYSKGTSTRMVTISDAVSVADKIKIAKTYKLKGVAVYKVDGVSDPNLWSVLGK